MSCHTCNMLPAYFCNYRADKWKCRQKTTGVVYYNNILTPQNLELKSLYRSDIQQQRQDF